MGDAVTGLAEYPVDRDGNMLGYPVRNTRKWVDGEYVYYPTPHMSNTPFNATMTVEGMTRGRSSIKFELTGAGKRWEMFATDFCELAQRASISNGEVAGMWEVCKRGANYGLRMVK